MQTRSHTHEIELPIHPNLTFSLLLIPSAICHWWSADRAIIIPKKDGTWAAAWGEDVDEPDYVTSARIDVYEPPHRLVLTDYQYHAKTGEMPFEADFRVEFTVREVEGGSVLRVEQHGFPGEPEADDYYAACQQGWHDTFEGVRRYVEEATAQG